MVCKIHVDYLSGMPTTKTQIATSFCISPPLLLSFQIIELNPLHYSYKCLLIVKSQGKARSQLHKFLSQCSFLLGIILP